jgi:hypothetical protein
MRPPHPVRPIVDARVEPGSDNTPEPPSAGPAQVDLALVTSGHDVGSRLGVVQRDVQGPGEIVAAPGWDYPEGDVGAAGGLEAEMDHSVATDDDKTSRTALHDLSGHGLALLDITADKLLDGQPGASQPRCRGLADPRTAAPARCRVDEQGYFTVHARTLAPGWRQPALPPPVDHVQHAQACRTRRVRMVRRRHA